MRELKAGTNLTDLVEVVVSADKDGDDDYYVSFRWKYATSDGDPIDTGTTDDERLVAGTYIRDHRLEGIINASEQAVAMEALTNGGITDIEAFLEA